MTLSSVQNSNILRQSQPIENSVVSLCKKSDAKQTAAYRLAIRRSLSAAGPDGSDGQFRLDLPDFGLRIMPLRHDEPENRARQFRKTDMVVFDRRDQPFDMAKTRGAMTPNSARWARSALCRADLYAAPPSLDGHFSGGVDAVFQLRKDSGMIASGSRIRIIALIRPRPSAPTRPNRDSIPTRWKH